MIDREAVAALEHEQWAHWTAYMLDNLTDTNIARWRQQIDCPYSALTDSEKESDREWADKAIAVVLGINRPEMADVAFRYNPDKLDDNSAAEALYQEWVDAR